MKIHLLSIFIIKYVDFIIVSSKAEGNINPIFYFADQSILFMYYFLSLKIYILVNFADFSPSIHFSLCFFVHIKNPIDREHVNKVMIRNDRQKVKIENLLSIFIYIIYNT